MKTVTVNVAGDGTVEGNEGFVLRLSDATGGVSIASSAAFATILNDDAAALFAARLVATAPTLTASDKTVKPGTSLAASSLFTVADTGGAPIMAYRFTDRTSAKESGSLAVYGVKQKAGTVVEILASGLSSTQFLTGAARGADELWMSASNGSNRTGWSRLTVTAGSLAA